MNMQLVPLPLHKNTQNNDGIEVDLFSNFHGTQGPNKNDGKAKKV